jgi:hypothetical protein
MGPSVMQDTRATFNALHHRLVQGVLEIGNSLSLVITGRYAVQAHQLSADNVHYVK